MFTLAQCGENRLWCAHIVWMHKKTLKNRGRHRLMQKSPYVFTPREFSFNECSPFF